MNRRLGITILFAVTLLLIQVISGSRGRVVAQGESGVDNDAMSARDQYSRPALDLDSTAAASFNTQNVEFVGHIGGTAYALAIKDNYAYFGEGATLTILDINDPMSPIVIGKSPLLSSFVNDVAIAGNYAYVAVYNGLQVVDVTNPAMPHVVGFYDFYQTTNEEISGVAVSGNYVYIAAGYNGGLQILNATDPTALTQAGSYNTPGAARGVTVAGNFAYVADDWGGLQIINVAEPSMPTQAGFINMRDAADVTVSGSYAYVSTYFGLRIIDVGNSFPPREVASVSLPLHYKGDAPIVVDNRAYVATNQGLRIFNVEDPTTPIEIGQFDAPGVAIAIAGNHVYVADEGHGVQIINVSNPAMPSAAGSYKTLGLTRDIFVTAGNYAYVMADPGLRIVDITEPTMPVSVGSLDIPDQVKSITVAGNYAYIANGTSLRIVDVANPIAPVAAGFLETYFSHDVDVTGNYAYIADDESGLRIVNITDPAMPVQTAIINLPEGAIALDVVGNYAYVALGSGGLQIIKVTNPAAPSKVSLISTSGGARGVVVAGNYAYVVGHNGLWIFDISDPVRPVELSHFVTPEYANGVTVAGDYAYIAEYAGLRVINVNDAVAPTQAGFFDTPGQAMSAALIGDHIYVADETGGLLILKFTGNEDDDEDGQTNEAESAAPNNGDGNVDGTPDSLQANVTSLPNINNGDYVTLATPPGTELANVEAITNPAPITKPEGAIFPAGFLGFGINGVANGTATTVEIFFESGVTAETYYKYGPTPDNPTDHWYEFLFDGTTGAEILADKIILHFVDGGRGDGDLTPNGFINDPGAPVIMTPPGTYLSPAGTGNLTGKAFTGADILFYVQSTNTWDVFYDGSYVKTPKNIDAFAFDGEDILLSFAANQAIVGQGTFTGQDIARFSPSSLGYNNTAGSFAWVFDGSDVGLTTSGENIDALWLDAQGRFYLSTTGTAKVNGPGGTITAHDEDVLRFTSTALGLTTAGTWELYWDATAVPGMGVEDIGGYWEDANGDRYVTIAGAFTLGSVKGNGKSIVKFTSSGGGWRPSLVTWLAAGATFPTNLDGIEMAR